MAQTFVGGGVKAAAVWGAMPKEERRAVLARFHEGDLDVVTNCNVLTEGFDEPAVDCILMARPTKSLLLYTKVAAERIDRFRFEPPEEIAEATDLAWLAAADGGYRLLLPQGEFTVQSTLLGDHEVRFRRQGAEDFKTVGRGQNAAAAVGVADNLVHRHYPDAVRLLSRDAGWRTRDATERQLELLRKRGLPAPPQLSRGQASWMLSYVLGGR